MSERFDELINAIGSAVGDLESSALDDGTARAFALLTLRASQKICSEGDDRGGAALTEREREVHSLVVSGRTNPEIASELFISVNTVRFHVSKILRKFGAKSRMGLVVTHEPSVAMAMARRDLHV